VRERSNVFAGIALERNAERRDDPAWAAAQCADPHARFLLLGADAPGGRPALTQPALSALRWLDQEECRRFAPGIVPTYLGGDDDGPRFSLAVDAALAERAHAELGGAFVDLRHAGRHLPALDAGLFAFARAIAHWHTRARWCGACGSPVALHALGHRGQCTNPACGIEHFPRVDPAMIVIVGWHDRCLLGCQSHWARNHWSTLAGFIEPGESLEDAVRREVFEESGVRVGACTYHSSQPWPFPSSLMLGFTAAAQDPTLRLGRELRDARWFGVEDIVQGLAAGTLILPPRLSVAHQLIAHWLRERSGLELAQLLPDASWRAPHS
jgi:NAD+ diphosphatase